MFYILEGSVYFYDFQIAENSILWSDNKYPKIYKWWIDSS